MSKKLESMTKAELIKEVRRLKRKMARDTKARIESISLVNKYLDERSN